MSVDILPDEASTRSQQRGGFKDEGYSELIWWERDNEAGNTSALQVVD